MADPVVIADYSDEWPQLFAEEAHLLRGVFAPDIVDIEHIGSTSVPGMGAKPIVDILLGADSLLHIERRIDRLKALGYRHVPDFESQLPQRRYFSKPEAGDGRFHVHAVARGDPFWREQIAFRDALRSDRRVFDEYLALKHRLAERHRDDRAAYTDAKAPFIRRVLDRLAAKDGA